MFKTFSKIKLPFVDKCEMLQMHIGLLHTNANTFNYMYEYNLIL